MKTTMKRRRVLELSAFYTKTGTCSFCLHGGRLLTIYISLPRSDRAFQHMHTLAQRYARTKFVSIVGNKCIPDLPDSRVPMIIIYRKGEIRQQLIAWGADHERRIEGAYYVIPNSRSNSIFHLHQNLKLSCLSRVHWIYQTDLGPGETMTMMKRMISKTWTTTLHLACVQQQHRRMHDLQRI